MLCDVMLCSVMLYYVILWYMKGPPRGRRASRQAPAPGAYMCVYMYICIYVYVCVCVHIYIYIHTSVVCTDNCKTHKMIRCIKPYISGDLRLQHPLELRHLVGGDKK